MSSTKANARCVGQWRVVARPAPALVAVAALSPTNVWAVGDTGGADYHSVIAHWTGDRLTVTRGPKSHSLSGITALSPADVWAVGSDIPHGRALIEHWNGTGGRRLSTPRGVSGLYDIVMESRASGWAVGSTTDFRPVAMHWNGRFWKKWVLLRWPNEGSLSAVAAGSAKDVWAVGSQGGEHSVNTI